MTRPLATLTVDFPVQNVTVLEDRAHVQRTGSVSLPVGPARLRLSRVSPVLVNKTVHVTAAGAEVVDARVDRRVLHSRAERSTAELEQALERLDEAQRQLGQRLHQLDQRRKRAERLLKHCTTEVVEDAGWGREEGEAWAGQFARFQAQLEATREAESAALVRLRAITRETEALHQRMALAARPDARHETLLTIDLDVKEAGEIRVSVEYIVPGACWRPHHRAHLLTDTRLVFETDASVWQNTGEDWTDAALSFSTERPSLGTRPPPLDPDPLALERTDDTVDVEVREQEIHTTGVAGARPGGKPEVPGIDDGGEPLSLRAEGPATIPSDGRPYRVPIARFEVETRLERVCMPELVQSVLLRTTQTNPGGRPVLAGPCDLVRDCGVVGRTKVDFVGPGEPFELGWGPDPDLRVKRRVRTEPEKSNLLGAWTKQRHTVHTTLSNLGPQARELVLTERVWVSEVDKVKISVDPKKTTSARQPDADGMMTWRVKVGARDHARLALCWVLEKHDSVKGL